MVVVQMKLVRLFNNLKKKFKNKVKVQKNPTKVVNLFSDSFAAQNKNLFTMIILLYYVNYR